MVEKSVRQTQDMKLNQKSSNEKHGVLFFASKCSFLTYCVCVSVFVCVCVWSERAHWDLVTVSSAWMAYHCTTPTTVMVSACWLSVDRKLCSRSSTMSQSWVRDMSDNWRQMPLDLVQMPQKLKIGCAFVDVLAFCAASGWDLRLPCVILLNLALPECITTNLLDVTSGGCCF